MSQGLHLSQRMGLQQTLSPQMQQSLALLQAPTLELAALVEQELQQNPVLEEMQAPDAEQEEKGERSEAEVAADPQEPPADVTFDPATDKPGTEQVDDFQAEFDRLAQMDQEWRDHFTQANAPLRERQEDEEKRQFMFDSLVAGTSLQETLLEQLRLSDLPEALRSVGEMIVGNIDDHGYLKAGADELSFSTGVPVADIESVLRLIQAFHPPGIGARNLRECLLLQLDRAGQRDSLEYRIIHDHMEALGKRRFPEIARMMREDVLDVQEAAGRIAHLEPRPGRAFMADTEQYVVAEIFVRRSGDDYVVTSNRDHIPHLRISNHYKDLMSRADAPDEVRDYIRNKIQAGKFLIRSIHQRQETILRIAREILLRQREFMEKGVACLRPMTMAQMAEVVGVHETTISRAVSGKYMETPQGVFEMRYFFSSGVSTTEGSRVSNTSVKQLLTELVAAEDSSEPLSDEELVKTLQSRGIQIARRTVAKYRTEMNILPSNLRRKY